ncbi:MAG: TIM barrel protein [Clostridium sp.]|nr:TIM barrel protein [Clostridium sp.]
MRFGVQMFGPGLLCRENPEKFFRALADARYQLIEPCLFLDGAPADADKIPIWTIDELHNYKPLYEKYGLKILSCHVFTQSLETAADKLKKLHTSFGVTQFILAGRTETTREGCLAYAEKLTELAEELKSTPIQLLLHNGAEDIHAKIDGKTAYEWLLDACKGMVGAQPDVGWLLYGGEDVEAFLWRNKDKILSLHYKDFKKNADGALTETAIGKGLVDVEACFQFARAMELPQFTDMDGNENDLLADIQGTAALFNSLTQCRSRTKSTLCIYDLETGEVTKLHTFDRIIEAPNWLKDGDAIIYNSEGFIWNYSISEDSERKIPSGECCNCNNDHVLSPDHSQIAVSHSAPGTWESKIYILPITGGTPRLVTPNGPSYLHGWSPDGSELAYCAFREHDGELCVDIYSIPVEENQLEKYGQEKQLTSHAAFNDGPEYDPDNAHIWFNSTRSGLMQIWKMERDGSNQTQMTFEEQNNWFAHVSPDGKKVINLAYSKLGLDANEHLPNMNVSLWLMNPDGTGRKKLLDFFGGQGSVNVNSWAPDNRRFAFVTYELEHK